MIRKSLQSLSLLTRFNVVSLILTLFVAAGLGWQLETALKHDILWEVAENSARQAGASLNPNLTAADLRGAMPVERLQELDALIQATLLNAGIVRIKIWNRDGLLVYSDDRGNIGNIFPVAEDLARALNGEIAAEISTLDEAENARERDLATTLYEIYVPLQLTGSREISGAYEVYYDLATLQPRLTRLRWLVWSGIGVSFLLLYIALFLIVRNASRDLIQRNVENQRLLRAEQGQRKLAETFERVSRALSEILDLRKLLDLICRESVDIFKTKAAFLWLLEGGELVGFAAHGPGAEEFIGLRFPIYDPHLLSARVARERKSILVNDAPNSPNVDHTLVERFGTLAMMGIPLLKGERLLGALMILDSDDPQRFTAEDLKTATIFGVHAALAVDNAQLYERSNLHLENERALREIDLAIAFSPDLDRTLDVVLYQTRKQLGVEACAILRLQADSKTLECQSSQGFESGLIQHRHLLLGEGRAGKAVQEQRLFGRSEIELVNQVPDRAELLAAERFNAYFIAPLMTKNILLGALEVYHRAPLKISTEWLKFLETLAGQAAIAIDNATLFHDLQRSNEELALAYEAAIEGWARALELRDKETEGHTRRVTDMTEKLARRMGFEGETLRHIRRGAMLHDIGKMGTPDAILLKPDQLTPEEMLIMRQHPMNAYHLLEGISYLREDIEIPYCHHEKWDGTGYPRGLKGEEIPLPARIFAIADVFDALTADRPYRKAWDIQRTIQYLRSESGKHFDPQVVDAFLQMVEEEGL